MVLSKGEQEMKHISIWLMIGLAAAGVSACGGSKTGDTAAAPSPTAAPAVAESAAEDASEEAGSTLDFELVNATGYDIKELYLSPSTVDNWEENMVPAGQILANGSSVKVSFTGYDADVELWDLKAIEENGDAHEYKELKLTEITKLTLNAEDATEE
jgi:hypothetical protein